MRILKKNTAISHWFFIFDAQAQLNPSLLNIQNYVTRVKSNIYDSSYTDLHFIIGNSIHYLYPVYQLLGDSNKFSSKFTAPVYYDLLSQSVSFLGDYEAALECQDKSDTTRVSDVENRQIGEKYSTIKGY